MKFSTHTRTLYTLGIMLGLLAPQVVFAQTIQVLLSDLVEIIGLTFPVIIGLAVLFFLWGLLRYMLNTDDVEGRKGARNVMFWGIIIIFVMVSIWGFVNFLSDIIDLDTEIPDDITQLQGEGS